MSQNTLKTPTTLRSRDGDVVAYLLELNDIRVGFDATGKILFYDVKLNFVNATPQGADTDVISSVTTDMAAVAPSRIFNAYHGAVAAYGEEVAAGAIVSRALTKTASGECGSDNCNASSVCTYGDGIGTSCTWTYYYCYDSSGNGGYSTTKGGFSGTTGGNKVTGDSKLSMTVNNAFTTAAKKMQGYLRARTFLT